MNNQQFNSGSYPTQTPPTNYQQPNPNNYQQPYSGNYQQPNPNNYQQPYSGNYQQPYSRPYQPTVEPQQPTFSKGTSIASMVLGISSIVMLWMPFICIPASIVGIILGIDGQKKAKAVGAKSSFATAGLVCAIAGAALCVLWLILAATFVSAFNELALFDGLDLFEEVIDGIEI